MPEEETPISDDIKLEVQQTESLKLTKNSKGYTWTIKILETNFDRIVQLDNLFKERYGKE